MRVSLNILHLVLKLQQQCHSWRFCKSLWKSLIFQTIDQCVEQKNQQCIDITWKYIEFFCGNTFPCQSRGVPESTLQAGLEKAMHNVEKNFFVVGVLEQFDDTLHLFEKLLPRYFNGATEVYHSDSKFWFIGQARAWSSTEKGSIISRAQKVPPPKIGT